MLFAYRASRLTSGIVFFWNNYSITATSALSEGGESSLFRLVLDSDLDNHSCGTIRDMSSPRRWDKDCWIVLINRAVSSTAAYFLVLSSVSITCLRKSLITSELICISCLVIIFSSLKVLICSNLLLARCSNTLLFATALSGQNSLLTSDLPRLVFPQSRYPNLTRCKIVFCVSTFVSVLCSFLISHQFVKICW